MFYRLLTTIGGYFLTDNCRTHMSYTNCFTWISFGSRDGWERVFVQLCAQSIFAAIKCNDIDHLLQLINIYISKYDFILYAKHIFKYWYCSIVYSHTTLVYFPNHYFTFGCRYRYLLWWLAILWVSLNIVYFNASELTKRDMYLFDNPAFITST